MVIRSIYMAFLFFGFMQIAYAQQSSAVKALARVQEDKVILRWAPLNERVWDQGNQYGYIIERFTISKNGILDTLGTFEKQMITSEPVKPWPLEDWETIITDHPFIPIAAQALYGEKFEVSTSKNFKQFLEQKRESENRFGFALLAADHSAQAATAMGLRFEDKTCQAGEKYLYTIYVSQQNKDYPIDTAFVIADMNQIDVLEEVKDVTAHFGDRFVKLNWDTFYYQDTYTSYQIEKSEDGKHYYSLNNMPLIQTSPSPDRKMMFVDSLAQNDLTYYYRLRGLTPFGETGPPSVIIKGKGIASLNGNTATIDSINILENGDVHLFWHMVEKYEQALSGYEILRGPGDQGPFESVSGFIKGSKAHEFIDEHMKGSTAYYVVKAIGKDSISPLSFPQLVQKEDDTPPSSPKGLQGSIDKAGKVHLEWEKGQEDDLLGYRIFSANSPDEEFALVSHHTIKDAFFIDSIQIATLNKEIYYKIIALDNHLNPSAFSETLMLKKPDVIPPVAAIITDVLLKEGSISLQWLASPSQDASAYEVLRLEDKKRTYQVLSTSTHIQDSLYTFEDTLITAGESYRYILRTVDEAGLSSDHPSIPVQAIDAGKRPAIEDINFNIERDARQITLQWKYAINSKVKGYRIYRASSEPGILRLHKYISALENSFIDHHLQINNTYRYAIQAVFEDGAESRISEDISIIY